MNNNQNINNTMLSRYADNLTNVTYITNPAIAREEEIKRLILTLLTPEKSAILVGKPGIGKTAIVEGLAYKIRRNEVPDLLKGYQIYRINVAAALQRKCEAAAFLLSYIGEVELVDFWFMKNLAIRPALDARIQKCYGKLI